jgi:hypothetical protein
MGWAVGYILSKHKIKKKIMKLPTPNIRKFPKEYGKKTY